MLEGPEKRKMSRAIALNRTDMMAGRPAAGANDRNSILLHTHATDVIMGNEEDTPFSGDLACQMEFIRHNECNFSQNFTDYEESNSNVS